MLPLALLVLLLFISSALADRLYERSLLPTKKLETSTASDEVAAARDLLSSLLALEANNRTSLLYQLMPPGVDPCMPAGSSEYPPGAATTAPPDVEWDGSCGPQPETDLLNDATASASSDGLGGAEAPPPSGLGASLPACMWSWLSCYKWRIVAINLRYCGTATQATAAPGTAGAAANATTSTTSNSKSCSAVPLRGFLPASAPQLSALVSLDLSGHAGLLGGLPLTAWEFSWNSLKVLNMSSSGLAGTLPSDWLALPSLEVLDLSRNALQGTLPAGMSSLSRLRELRLASSLGLLGDLPSAWAGLASLQLLDVRDVCRLCGSSAVLPGLATALTAGSHLDQPCRLQDCDSPTRNMQGVFQGVMAGFASVLGLTAVVLFIRRVHQCLAGSVLQQLPDTIRPRHGAYPHRTAPASGDFGSTDPGFTDYAYGGGGGGGGGGQNRGGGPQAYRGYRDRRRRLYNGPPVPLYVVEFGPTGEPAEWRVEMDLGWRTAQGLLPVAQQLQPGQPHLQPWWRQESEGQISTARQGQEDDERQQRLRRRQQRERSRQLRQLQQQAEQRWQERRQASLEQQRQSLPANSLGPSLEVELLQRPGLQSQSPVPEGTYSDRRRLHGIDYGRSSTGTDAGGAALSRALRPPALAAAALQLPAEDAQEGSAPDAGPRAPPAAARPGTPRPSDMGVGELQPATPLQPTPINAARLLLARYEDTDRRHSGYHFRRTGFDRERNGDRRTSGSGITSLMDDDDGYYVGDAGDPGADFASAGRSKALWRAAVRLAPPPEAVLLMPDGWTVCLGRRLAQPAAAAEACGGGDGGVAGSGIRGLRCASSDGGEEFSTVAVEVADRADAAHLAASQRAAGLHGDGYAAAAAATLVEPAEGRMLGAGSEPSGRTVNAGAVARLSIVQSSGGRASRTTSSGASEFRVYGVGGGDSGIASGNNSSDSGDDVHAGSGRPSTVFVDGM